MKMQKFNSTGQSLSLQLCQVMKHQASADLKHWCLHSVHNVMWVFEPRVVSWKIVLICALFIKMKFLEDREMISGKCI